jgi:Cytochrome c554 and c-prime
MMSRSKILIVASISTVLIVASGVGYQLLHGSVEVASAHAATFVGSEACATCHQTEADLWHKSQHRLAMQHANENSVMGDFSDASFDYYGVHSRFFRRDGKYLVETDGPDGKLATLRHTSGIQLDSDHASSRSQSPPTPATCQYGNRCRRWAYRA